MPKIYLLLKKKKRKENFPRLIFTEILCLLFKESFLCIENCFRRSGVVAHTFNSALWRQRQSNLCEFEASQVYMVRCKNNNQTKNKHKPKPCFRNTHLIDYEQMMKSIRDKKTLAANFTYEHKGQIISPGTSYICHILGKSFLFLSSKAALGDNMLLTYYHNSSQG